MPADELVVDPARDRFERRGAAFFEQQREEVGLKEQVAELVLQLGVVAGKRGIRDLVRLLDRMRDDRLRRLNPVPRAVAPEALRQALEIEKSCCECVGVGQLGENATRSACCPIPSACSRPGTSSRP
jgi:hypothetical protein